MNATQNGFAIPPCFEKSYTNFEKWPSILVDKSIYLEDLQTYMYRLDDLEKDLFLKEDDNKIEVAFRDFIPSQPPSNPNAFDDKRLKDILGDASKPSNPHGHPCGPLVTKKDPKCRYMYVKFFKLVVVESYAIESVQQQYIVILTGHIA
jgi:hypothetical protein